MFNYDINFLKVEDNTLKIFDKNRNLKYKINTPIIYSYVQGNKVYIKHKINNNIVLDFENDFIATECLKKIRENKLSQ